MAMFSIMYFQQVKGKKFKELRMGKKGELERGREPFFQLGKP